MGKIGGLFRINQDGSLDRSYNPTPEFNQEVSHPDPSARWKNNWLQVNSPGGEYNGSVCKTVWPEFNPDGSLDETF